MRAMTPVIAQTMPVTIPIAAPRAIDVKGIPRLSSQGDDAKPRSVSYLAGTGPRRARSVRRSKGGATGAPVLALGS
jgi:hypothetical protein